MNNRQPTPRERVPSRLNHLLRTVGPLGAVLAAVFIAGSCAVGPNYRAPKRKAPAAWAGVPYAATNATSVATTDAAQLAKWWERFQDPKLTSLVEDALKANLDVRLAETRLREARASRGIVAGGLWPSLTASAAYSRNGTSTRTQNTFLASFDAAWELDLFGGVRRSVEAADATVQVARENIRDAQVTLTSEVALNYIELRSFQEQIAIADDNLKAQQHTADLTRQRLGAGFASALDVANADAQVATTASSIPVLETSVHQTIYALSVLLGRPPADLLDELSNPAPVPPTPPQIPIGLPSDLLRRRPDIRAAEAGLHAATAGIGVAESDFFPKFSLTGSLNSQSNRLATLFNEANRAWAIGPQVTWPIFQGGSIASNVRLQEALRDESYVTYQKTVLTALQDVENALIAFDKEWDHRKALADSLTYNRKALDLSRQLYTEGTADFLSVLVAERSVFSAEVALAQSKQAISTDLVALYKALGGGWEDKECGK